MAWKLITIGYDLAYLTNSLGKSTPSPHIANKVILYAVCSWSYCKEDTKVMAMLVIYRFKFIKQSIPDSIPPFINIFLFFVKQCSINFIYNLSNHTLYRILKLLIKVYQYLDLDLLYGDIFVLTVVLLSNELVSYTLPFILITTFLRSMILLTS